MKKILLLLVYLLFLSLGSKSQNANRFPLLHDRILKAKLIEIRTKLKLDQATFDSFRTIYIKYDKEISDVDIRKMSRIMNVEPDSLSSNEAELLIINQIEGTKKLIDIRQTYYKIFMTVLTPQQIIKLYQTEADLRKKVLNEVKKRIKSR